MSDYTQEALLALELARVRADNAALSAHVERLSRLLERGMAPMNFPDLFESDVERALSEAPATSLARLKALWQADALDELMPAICDVADRAEVRSVRDQLRRQAKGDDQ